MPVRYSIKRSARLCKPTRKEIPRLFAADFELEDRPELLAALEKCCLALFERWCENRRVVPLAYLMHVWPMPKPSVRLAQRLSSALRDLRISHADSLDCIDRQLIGNALDAIDSTLRH